MSEETGRSYSTELLDLQHDMEYAECEVRSLQRQCAQLQRQVEYYRARYMELLKITSLMTDTKLPNVFILPDGTRANIVVRPGKGPNRRTGRKIIIP